MSTHAHDHARRRSVALEQKRKDEKTGRRREERARKTRGPKRVGENKRQDEPRARKSSWIRVGVELLAGWLALAAGGSELEKNLISGERIQTAGDVGKSRSIFTPGATAGWLLVVAAAAAASFLKISLPPWPLPWPSSPEEGRVCTQFRPACFFLSFVSFACPHLRRFVWPCLYRSLWDLWLFGNRLQFRRFCSRPETFVLSSLLRALLLRGSSLRLPFLSVFRPLVFLPLSLLPPFHCWFLSSPLRLPVSQRAPPFATNLCNQRPRRFFFFSSAIDFVSSAFCNGARNGGWKWGIHSRPNVVSPDRPGIFVKPHRAPSIRTFFDSEVIVFASFAVPRFSSLLHFSREKSTERSLLSSPLCLETVWLWSLTVTRRSNRSFNDSTRPVSLTDFISASLCVRTRR